MVLMEYWTWPISSSKMANYHFRDDLDAKKWVASVVEFFNTKPPERAREIQSGGSYVAKFKIYLESGEVLENAFDWDLGRFPEGQREVKSLEEDPLWQTP